MTLGPLQILAPVLLLGVLAAAIPVLLHLLAKVKAPQVFFPTLRFLRMSMDKTARRRRVQHWLLMLLRMLALAVLALAVAQPLVRAAGQLGSDRDTAVVVILDNSMSMQAHGHGGTRLESARSALLRFLQAHHFQQTALIVTNGAAARTPPTELIDRFKVIDQARAVAPGAGRADLAAAIEYAQELLAETNQPNREIYVFSDLQQVSARGLELLRSDAASGAAPPSLLVVTPEPAGAETAGDADDASRPTNLAVSEIVIDQPNLMAGQPIQLDVTVSNHSRLAQKAMVRLFQDGNERPDLMQVIDLSSSADPGASRHLSFAVTFADPGNHFGSVQVQRVNQAGVPDKDDLGEDDRRYFSLDLADRVNVLLVKQRHDLDSSADAGFMLRRLMSLRLASGPANPFRLAEITAAEFAPTLLANLQVVITSDVAGFTPEEVDAYRRFVERGGTWMIWLGPSADLNVYNQVLAGSATTAPDDGPSPAEAGVGRAGGSSAGPLLGGRLLRYVGSGTGGRETEGEPVFVQWVDEEHPMFRKVYSDLSPYRRLLVFRHAVLRRRSSDAGRVMARLSTGDPLLVEALAGKGRVLLFTTGTMPRWTNWLTQGQAFAIYQMLLATATRQQTGGRGVVTGQFGENELVSIELPGSAGSVPPGATRPEVSIRKPDEKIVLVKTSRAPSAGAPAPGAAAGLLAQFARTDQIGVYRWQLLTAVGEGDGGGPAKGRLAARGAFVVNAPAEESDLTPLSPAELTGLLPGRPVLVGHSLADLTEKIEQFRKGSPLWPYLLAVVLLLLAVEAKLANRHRPTLEAGLRPAFGAGGQPVPSQPAPAEHPAASS